MKRLIITESERAKILNMHGFKKMLSEATLVDLQNLLNTKFSAGLTTDGKYGPKTAAAIEKALGISSAPAGTTPDAATKAGTTPDAATKAGTTPVGGTPLSSNKTPPGSVAGTPNVGDIASADKGESSMVGV
jgi:peptidoglycan hydrolase-like protein with peptidoglycan-binding domain